MFFCQELFNKKKRKLPKKVLSKGEDIGEGMRRGGTNPTPNKIMNIPTDK